VYCGKYRCQKEEQWSFLSGHQNEVKYHNLKKANKYFENVVQFEYLGTTVINEIWCRKNLKAE
jgi:hypothetical protein